MKILLNIFTFNVKITLIGVAVCAIVSAGWNDVCSRGSFSSVCVLWLFFIQAALVTNKYHLAKSLIQKIRGKNDLQVKLDHGKSLAHILAETCKPDSSEELITQVSG